MNDTFITSVSEATISMDSTSFSKIEIKAIVAATRLNLYNRGRPHGANAILQEMESMAVRPMPSLSSVARILARLGLTHKRTGLYP
jgi:putative transposase